MVLSHQIGINRGLCPGSCADRAPDILAIFRAAGGQSAYSVLPKVRLCRSERQNALSAVLRSAVSAQKEAAGRTVCAYFFCAQAEQ